MEADVKQIYSLCCLYLSLMLRLRYRQRLAKAESISVFSRHLSGTHMLHIIEWRKHGCFTQQAGLDIIIFVVINSFQVTVATLA